jgi:hypothetical protein
MFYIYIRLRRAGGHERIDAGTCADEVPKRSNRV